MKGTCTILPLKAFSRAKSRLESVLSATERSTIARLMAVDTLRILMAVPEIDRVLIAGQSDEHALLAAEFGCSFVADDPALDVSENIARAAERPDIAHAATLLYLASDLPFLTVQDIRALIGANEGGLTICRASRDNGTNAMLAAPPRSANFSFGSNSAERHAEAARAAGHPVRVLDIAAFQRDVDVPEDLTWLSRYGSSGRSVAYLRDSGLAARLLQSSLPCMAS